MLVGIFQVLVLVVNYVYAREKYLLEVIFHQDTFHCCAATSAAFNSGGHWREGDDRRLPDDLLAAPEGP